MNMWVASITMALTILITGGVVEAVARLRHPNRIFMMQLGRARTVRDESLVRHVRIANAIVTLLGIALVFASPTPNTALIAALVCPFVSTGLLVGASVAILRSVKLERVPGRYQVRIDEAPSATEYISVPVQILHVLVIAIPSVIFAWVVSQISGQVPMHFDAAGNVNRMGDPSELWFMLATMLFDLVLLYGIIWAVAKERWALPLERAEEYAAAQLERRTLMVRMTEWIMLGVNASIALIWLGICGVWFDGYAWLFSALTVSGLVVMTAGGIIPLVVYVRPIIRVRDRLREIAGTEALGTRSDGWRWGGAIYYAPEDPAVFVSKRVGIGQTLNMARPAAWIFLGAIILIPLVGSIIFAIAS